MRKQAFLLFMSSTKKKPENVNQRTVFNETRTPVMHARYVNRFSLGWSMKRCARLVFKFSEDGAFWWLRQLLVLWQCHVSPQLNQHRLHCVVSLPIRKTRQLAWVDFSCSRVHTRQVDFRYELKDRWLVRVAVVAMYVHTVDSVFVHALPLVSRPPS